jgi:hypothetical protein
MYVVIVVVMTAQYLTSPEMHLLPGFAKYLPDLLSAMTMLYVFGAGVRQGFRNVSLKYWLIFGALGLIIICGPIINQEPPGPIVAGGRYYIRSIPLFFLPAVLDLSDRDLIRYGKLIVGMTLLQLPVSAYQRIKGVSLGEFTGDIVIGTLMDSGVVTLFTIAVLCVLGALTLRGRMSKLWFVVCFVPMLITVSINETKVTAILLPLAVITTFIVASKPGRRIGGAFRALVVMAAAAAIFVPFYNSLNKKDDGTQSFTIQQFLTDPNALNKYMELQAGAGTGKEAGRGDAMAEPFRALSGDPIKLAFGLGIGNVSKSGLGPQYSGRYQLEYWNFALVLSMSAFLFEIGVFGTSLVLILHLMVLMDAFYVSKHDEGFKATLALGYVGAWLVVTIGLFYATIHAFESISFLFWFYSGVFAARRQQLESSKAGRLPVYTFNQPAKPLRQSAPAYGPASANVQRAPQHVP